MLYNPMNNKSKRREIMHVLTWFSSIGTSLMSGFSSDPSLLEVASSGFELVSVGLGSSSICSEDSYFCSSSKTIYPIIPEIKDEYKTIH